MQITPMFKKFNIHKQEMHSSGYSIVTFSGRLSNSSYSFIPRLRYTKVLSDKTESFSNKVTAREELASKVKNPLPTRIIHSIHDKLKYGNKNVVRKIYGSLYTKIFKFIN